MFTFEFKYTREQLERACGEFTDIHKTVDNEICKVYDAKLGHSNLQITNYHNGEFYRVADCYHGIVAEYFHFSIDENSITISVANKNGRSLRAEKYLKQYAQCAMRVFALVKCGKLEEV